jgi:SAM-dependent methyltransferase
VSRKEFLAWVASLPPDTRDAEVETHFGIRAPVPASSPPGDHLIGYHASGVAPILHALLEVPVTADDTVIDLGAGLGKVAFLARLLTSATVRGIEIQPTLVHRARAAATRLGLDVKFAQADARTAAIEDGSVFFLYVPFTGPVLEEVVRRVENVARRHAIVVCALGIDLDREANWLVRRQIDSFWLAIYDSVVPGVPPRSANRRSVLGDQAVTIACERRA